MLRPTHAVRARTPSTDRRRHLTRSRASPVVRGAFAALASILVNACGGGGEHGTGVERPLTCPSASVPLCSTPTGAAAARDGASDGATRSAAALDNTTARTALNTNLTQLDAALVAQNVTDARAALSRARDAIATARGQLGSFPGDAADLGSIELMLDYIAPLLGVS